MAEDQLLGCVYVLVGASPGSSPGPDIGDCVRLQTKKETGLRVFLVTQPKGAGRWVAHAYACALCMLPFRCKYRSTYTSVSSSDICRQDARKCELHAQGEASSAVLLAMARVVSDDGPALTLSPMQSEYLLNLFNMLQGSESTY